MNDLLIICCVYFKIHLRTNGALIRRSTPSCLLHIPLDSTIISINLFFKYRYSNSYLNSNHGLKTLFAEVNLFPTRRFLSFTVVSSTAAPFQKDQRGNSEFGIHTMRLHHPYGSTYLHIQTYSSQEKERREHKNTRTPPYSLQQCCRIEWF